MGQTFGFSLPHSAKTTVCSPNHISLSNLMFLCYAISILNMKVQGSTMMDDLWLSNVKLVSISMLVISALCLTVSVQKLEYSYLLHLNCFTFHALNMSLMSDE
jgi:hypothetical protein